MKYEIESYFIPNNDIIPLLAYRASADLAPGEAGMEAAWPAEFFEEVFSRNLWPAAWRNGVYPFHHYHSTAHEVLGVYSGFASIQFGGEGGPIVDVRGGEAVVIPAGVSHRLVDSRGGFRVVGAYPEGQVPDLCRGDAVDSVAARVRIAKVPVPSCDPLSGPSGPLPILWAAGR